MDITDVSGYPGHATELITPKDEEELSALLRPSLFRKRPRDDSRRTHRHGRRRSARKAAGLFRCETSRALK